MTRDMRSVGNHLLRMAERLLEPPVSPVPAVMDELWIDPAALMSDLMQRALSAEADVPPRPSRPAPHPQPNTALSEPGLLLSSSEAVASPLTARPQASSAESVELTTGLLRTLADLQIMPRVAPPVLPDFPLSQSPAFVPQSGRTRPQSRAVADQPAALSGVPTLSSPAVADVGSNALDSVPTFALPVAPLANNPDDLHLPAEPSLELLALANAAHWSLDNPTPAQSVGAMLASPGTWEQHSTSNVGTQRSAPSTSRHNNVPSVGAQPAVPLQATSDLTGDYPSLGIQRAASDTYNHDSVSNAWAQRPVPLQETPASIGNGYTLVPQPPSASRLVRGAGGLAGILRANVAEADAPVLQQTVQPNLPDAQMSVALPDSPVLPELSTPPNGRPPQVDVNNMDIEYLMERMAEYLEYEYLRTYGTSGGR